MEMDERRASRRHKSFLRGIVYFDKRRSETACLVRDLSEDGARIVLSQTITIPDVIELQIPQREQMVSARVQWRRATRSVFPSARLRPRPRRGKISSSSASPSLKPKSPRSSAPSSVLSVTTMATAGSRRPKTQSLQPRRKTRFRPGSSPGQAFSESCSEHPLALQIDHRSRLGERKRHRIVERGEGVGADETMLLAHAADLALDRPRRLKLAFGLERRRADDEPLILDGFRDLFLRRRCELSKYGAKKRHHRLLGSEAQTRIPAVAVIAARNRSGIMLGPKGILMAAKRPVEGREHKDHIRTAIRIGVSRVMRVPVGGVTSAHGISLCDRRQQHGGTAGKHH